MFQGFTEKASDFLWGVRFNNYRDWFLEHKAEYLREVQTPLKELGMEVFDALMECYPESDLELHVSRIYRDARRLHDKGPYKDHLWFSIRPEGSDHWTRRPVFWFELRPEGYGYGMGIYEAKPVTMALFRKELDRKSPELLKLLKQLDSQTELVLDAPEYKRPKGTAEPPLDKWYNRKGLNLSCERGWDEIIGSRAIVDELNRAYRFLMPFHQYVMDLCIRSELNYEG